MSYVDDEKQVASLVHADEPQTGKLMTRAQAATMLGMSTSSFIRHIEGKHIQPIRDGRGWHYFAFEHVAHVRDTVVARARRTQGEQPAADAPVPIVPRDIYVRVLQGLDDGRSVVDLAKDLALFVTEIEPIFEDWLKYRHAFFLNANHLKAIWGAFELHDTYLKRDAANSPDALVRACQSLSKSVDTSEVARSCKWCRDGELREAKYCGRCAETKFSRKPTG